MARLVQDCGDIEALVDFFVRERFDGLTDDGMLEEAFINYFKRRILEGSFDTEKLYLSDDEKTLQYAGRNTVEPVAEYFLIIANTDSKRKKRDYSERGAVFSIVHPIISTMERDHRYFSTCATTLYGFASNLSDDPDAEEFYNFLSQNSREMMDGLEEVLSSIANDGKISMNRFYESAVLRYITSTDAKEKDELAKVIAGVSYRAGIRPDEVPLESEHYHHLFETPAHKNFSDGHDPIYDEVFDELMRRSAEETERRYKKGYGFLGERSSKDPGTDNDDE